MHNHTLQQRAQPVAPCSAYQAAQGSPERFNTVGIPVRLLSLSIPPFDRMHALYLLLNTVQPSQLFNAIVPYP
jgi:hypothetical protein